MAKLWLPNSRHKERERERGERESTCDYLKRHVMEECNIFKIIIVADKDVE